MKALLKRLKLIDHLSMALPINKIDFIGRLYNITDAGGVGVFSNFFDLFSSSKNEFKGQIDLNGFKLQRRVKMFDTSMNFAIANGQFKEADGELIIDTEINGLTNYMLFFYSIVLVFYLLIIALVTFGDSETPFIAIPFILFHGFIMFAIPYFMMRRSVKRLKYELEREFFFLTKK